MYESERERVRWTLEALPKFLLVGASERRLSDQEIRILAYGFSKASYSISPLDPRRLAAGKPRHSRRDDGTLPKPAHSPGQILTDQARCLHSGAPGSDPALAETYQTYYASPAPPARSYTMSEWIEHCFTWLGRELTNLSRQYDAGVVRP
jgi:hypothetical protein